MPIKLPERPVATRDELRGQYVAQHKEFLARVERSITTLCGHHRIAYEKYLFERRKAEIQPFLDNRKPNETAYDHYLAPHRDYLESMQAETDYWRVQRLQDLKQKAEWRMEHVAKYTTHPRLHRSYSNEKCRTFDFEDRSSYQSWLENPNRPNFAVAWSRTADDTIKAEVKKLVDEIVAAFIDKTLDKVADILIAKKEYGCELKSGSFHSGSFEGDLTISFPDGTSFRTHVILKTNYTAYGNPYAQYPLTFHDVVAETGGIPSAMLSQDEVHNSFGVPKWTEPKKQKKPWSLVKIGDVLRTKTMTKCICLGTRGNMATVFHPDKGEEQVTADDIVAILARTTCDTWKQPFCVRVEPCESVTFTVETADSVVQQFGKYAYGVKVDNAMRKADVREILKRVDG
jgi:hypothetical protein